MNNTKRFLVVTGLFFLASILLSFNDFNLMVLPAALLVALVLALFFKPFYQVKKKELSVNMESNNNAPVEISKTQMVGYGVASLGIGVGILVAIGVVIVCGVFLMIGMGTK